MRKPLWRYIDDNNKRLDDLVDIISEYNAEYNQDQFTRHTAIKAGKIRRDIIEMYKEISHLRSENDMLKIDIRNLVPRINYKGEQVYEYFSESPEQSKESSREGTEDPAAKTSRASGVYSGYLSRPETYRNHESFREGSPAEGYEYSAGS